MIEGVRQKGYSNLIALRKVCDKARQDILTSRRKNKATRFGEYLGFYSKPRRANEMYRMYWQVPGNKDVEHITLGTRDEVLAQTLIFAFVTYIGQNESDKKNDPHVTAVITHYINNSPVAQKGSSRRNHLLRLNELINENYPEITMSTLTRGMQKKLIAKMTPRYDVHSARNTMTGFGAAVTFACNRDDDHLIFSDEWVDVVMSRRTICDLIDRDPPEVRNWHPDPAGMARVIRELADNESVRRWIFLALFTALRPSHIFEMNARMITVELDVSVLDTRRLRNTATDENQKIDDLFRGHASWIKRRPQLPLPDSIRHELLAWGETPWVDANYDVILNAVKGAARKFEMPLLIPSSFRDFSKALIQYAYPYIGGPEVPFEQSEMWLGHRVTSKVHEGYGRFHPNYLRQATDAVMFYMRWLDKESGGVLFRQVPANSVSANSDEPEDGIPSQPAPLEPSGVPSNIVSRPTVSVKKLPEDKGLVEKVVLQKTEPAVCAVVVSNNPAEAPTRSSAAPLENHMADDLHPGSRGELAGLHGSKLLQTGHIEGFHGVFRRVTDGRECGIWGDEYPQDGARYILPDLPSWFQVAGIEIYDTVASSTDATLIRVFIDKSNQTVIDKVEVARRMKASLNCSIAGWENHACDLLTCYSKSSQGALEYRDPNEPYDPPRGLLELLGQQSKRQGIQGMVGNFVEVIDEDWEPLQRGTKLDWRYMLRNMKAFFDLNHLRVYEVDLIVFGNRQPTRLFVDALTEKLVSVDEVRATMLDRLGCDPGGWERHSSFGDVCDFDFEGFIATTPKAGALDELHACEAKEFELQPVTAWH